MDRIYTHLTINHLMQYKQMLFLAGPRQVGKTTISLFAQDQYPGSHYLNWDNQSVKKQILSGQDAVAQSLQLNQLQAKDTLVIFDEIHKYKNWKNFLKGFFDTYHSQIKIIVTGSAKLDLYRKGNDSLMGRYFIYRVHPLSLRECLVNVPNLTQEISDPMENTAQLLEQLFQFGGFPEPFLQKDPIFFNRWQKLRQQQLFREDIRDLANIQEMQSLELLAILLQEQVGGLLNHSAMANKINVAAQTVKRWLDVLENTYYAFRIYPWSHNVTRSLLKEPKVYLWDWSTVSDVGQKFENFVASHLLKATQFWTDYGFGEFGLYFLRDKDKREVDFLVTKNKKPWFLVEAKMSANQAISKSLHHFQALTGAEHAYQVCFSLPFVNKDCFSYRTPIIVPAATLLSKLC